MREIIFDDSAVSMTVQICDHSSMIVIKSYDHHPGPFQCRGGLQPCSPRQADLNCHDGGSAFERASVWGHVKLLFF